MDSAETATETVVRRPSEYWCRRDVAESYDSGRFDNLKGRVYRWREERAIELALGGLQPYSKILDAACGTGRITALLQRMQFETTGCDVSLAMMAVARRRMTSLGFQVPLVESSVEHLPYQNTSFDAATCIGLLMHLDAEARVRTLRELARCSRDRLVVQYVCADAFQRVSARMTGRPPGLAQYPVSRAEMRADFERSGLTERATFWILRGVSSSLIVVLTKSGGM
jgi:ubiquinone/menaquinone biosynthesis C-methylase UbiE